MKYQSSKWIPNKVSPINNFMSFNFIQTDKVKIRFNVKDTFKPSNDVNFYYHDYKSKELTSNNCIHCCILSIYNLVSIAIQNLLIN